MSLDNGLYIIRPKNSNDDALLIGPVPLPEPPLDVPVRVGGPMPERWLVRPDLHTTFTVWSGNGGPGDYRWIIKGDVLFVSKLEKSPPGHFRFEHTGDNLFTIGLPNEDFLLTVDKEADPQCTFKKADGSDEQRFQVIPVDRE